MRVVCPRWTVAAVGGGCSGRSRQAAKDARGRIEKRSRRKNSQPLPPQLSAPKATRLFFLQPERPTRWCLVHFLNLGELRRHSEQQTLAVPDSLSLEEPQRTVEMRAPSLFEHLQYLTSHESLILIKRSCLRLMERHNIWVSLRSLRVGANPRAELLSLGSQLRCQLTSSIVSHSIFRNSALRTDTTCSRPMDYSFEWHLPPVFVNPKVATAIHRTEECLFCKMRIVRFIPVL